MSVLSHKLSLLATAGLCLTLAGGCVHKSPKVTTVNAQNQEYTPKGAAKPWVIGGIYDKSDKSLAILINDNPVLRGSVSGPLPQTRLRGTYEGKTVEGICEFASAGPRGAARIVYQQVRRNTANTCRITIEGNAAATLYF